MQIHQLKAAFEELGASNDLGSIKSALLHICSEFGTVRRLDVLLARQGEKRQALCFLRMKTTEQERQVMRFLAVARFAGDLVIVVDLPPPERVHADTQAEHAQSLSMA